MLHKAAIFHVECRRLGCTVLYIADTSTLASSLGKLDLAGGALGLSKKGRPVVPDIAGPAHRRGDTVIDHQPQELLTVKNSTGPHTL